MSQHTFFSRLRKPLAVVTSFLLWSQTAFAGGIVVDGLTETQVAENGAVTDVTTSTILGGNAFNSFSRFDVESGRTVNLHVPSTANNLLNLVHEKTSVIEGALNSIQGGQIGGNVFFLNPHGFVVGLAGT